MTDREKLKSTCLWFNHYTLRNESVKVAIKSAVEHESFILEKLGYSRSWVLGQVKEYNRLMDDYHKNVILNAMKESGQKKYDMTNHKYPEGITTTYPGFTLPITNIDVFKRIASKKGLLQDSFLDECKAGIELWRKLEKKHGVFAKACDWNSCSKNSLSYAIHNQLQPGITRLTNQSLRKIQHVAYGVRFYENGWFEARIDSTKNDREITERLLELAWQARDFSSKRRENEGFQDHFDEYSRMREMRSRPGFSFKPTFKANMLRAIGLRLWDLKKEYPEETLSDCLQMIWNEFPELADMRIYDTKESNFERYRRRTNACIEACNILTFEE